MFSTSISHHHSSVKYYVLLYQPDLLYMKNVKWSAQDIFSPLFIMFRWWYQETNVSFKLRIPNTTFVSGLLKLQPNTYYKAGLYNHPDKTFMVLRSWGFHPVPNKCLVYFGWGGCRNEMGVHPRPDMTFKVFRKSDLCAKVWGRVWPQPLKSVFPFEKSGYVLCIFGVFLNNSNTCGSLSSFHLGWTR